MSTSTYVINLDAARREVQHPDGIPALFGGEQFIFPAELPDEALDPLLSDELGLVSFLVEVIEASDGDAGVKEVMGALIRRPLMLRMFHDALRKTFAILLGEQHADFLAVKPFLADYLRLGMALSKVYGVELGKLFRSADSSESASETSSPTSPATTGSTPDASGSGPDSPDSSDSVG